MYSWVCWFGCLGVFFFFDRVNRKDYSYTSSFGFSSVSPFILTFHKPHFVWVGLFFCHSNKSGMHALCCASKLLCFNQHRNKASKSVIYFWIAWLWIYISADEKKMQLNLSSNFSVGTSQSQAQYIFIFNRHHFLCYMWLHKI